MSGRIDWPRLLGDIAWMLGEPVKANPDIRVPAGAKVVAEYLGVPRGTVRNWLESAEPRHSDGVYLIRQWARLTGKSEDFVPLTRPNPIIGNRLERGRRKATDGDQTQELKTFLEATRAIVEKRQA